MRPRPDLRSIPLKSRHAVLCDAIARTHGPACPIRAYQLRGRILRALAKVGR